MSLMRTASPALSAGHRGYGPPGDVWVERSDVPAALGLGRRGMTLIELMVALVIVAGLSLGGVFVFNSITRANMKASAMRLSGYIKHTYSISAIHQQYHRLMIDLDNQEYWVETAVQSDMGKPPQIPADDLVVDVPSELNYKSRTKRRLGYDSDDPEGGALGLKRPSFKPSEESLIQRRKLQGAFFHSVTTAGLQEPRTTGRTSITFYPNGFVERSQIVISDGEQGFLSLEIQPLTGKVQIFTGKQEADRDFFEVEDDD